MIPVASDSVGQAEQVCVVREGCSFQLPCVKPPVVVLFEQGLGSSVVGAVVGGVGLPAKRAIREMRLCATEVPSQ